MVDDIIARIKALCKQRRAILLAHNYQPPEIQDIADLCGDSLELSVKAARTDAALIVFCGVHFMAETAAILCPDKTVLLPRRDAGCPMADMVTPEALRAKTAQLPPMPVVTYVNSSAAVKALSTICCTSANAVEVVNSLNAKAVLMTPDRNLARYTAGRTDTHIHYWEGFCPIHDRICPEDVQKARAAHPEAVFMAHPECRSEVLALADVVTSTSGMIRHAIEAPQTRFIVGTEIGILHPLQKAAPAKAFYPVSSNMVCPDMKKIALGDILHCLQTMEGKVAVPEAIRLPALKAVQAMIELALHR